MRLKTALIASTMMPLLALPRFSVKDAIHAEWQRQAPRFTDAELKKLPKKDRARLELTLQRIGAPNEQGTISTFRPTLLPPELEKPSLEVWEGLAERAKSPKERFTALHFLNRSSSPKALRALQGLGKSQARTWPKHLHLENAIATARLNGAALTPELHEFLGELKRLGKVEPVREQSARLRLVQGGLEKELLPRVKATPGSLLAILQAWNKGPWEKRESIHTQAIQAFVTSDESLFPWAELGLQHGRPGIFQQASWGLKSRLLGGIPDIHPEMDLEKACAPFFKAQNPDAPGFAPEELALLDPLQHFHHPEALKLALRAEKSKDPRVRAAIFPILREMSPGDADRIREELLRGPDPIARANAIADLEAMPKDLEGLIQLLWKPTETEGAQALFIAFMRWKLPEDSHKQLLSRFLEHPSWTTRLDAATNLQRLDPKTVWPQVPQSSEDEKAILDQAQQLAKRARPVRMRLTLTGKRSLTLKLDPTIAPINVANLVHLAKKGFYKGRRVSRIVPDFVVQMGSPLDTMDGGPGYSVRCENSLQWYSPGSVGMALSTKDSGGSQFFITLNGTPHLTGRYTRVGEVENLDQAMPLLDDLELGAGIEHVEILK